MNGIRMFRRATLAAVLGSAAAACGGGGGGFTDQPPQPQPLRVGIVSAFPQLSFDQPLVFAAVPGDATRVVVATRRGLIHIFDNDAAADTAEVLLDIRERVDDSGGEMGLLGLAFDPGYADNGVLYVNYTPEPTPMRPQRRTTIARFSPLQEIPLALEAELLSYDQPFANHNGGWIGFGPDNKLYIASGDGGGAGDPQNNAQNLGNLLGKILRIEPGGGVPDDNPFADEAGARGEIWAYGLRNPFRASFDRETGELWAADVGQSALEEVNVVERGGNYGWRKFEGTQVFNSGDPTPANAIAPLYEYDHGNGRCSVTGGHVYRGSAIPALVGRYLFADFCSREVWALRRAGSSVEVDALGTVPGRPTAFGEDSDGELYITAFDGKIYKLVPED
jgi:glucose/arabinose dehydrogenase